MKKRVSVIGCGALGSIIAQSLTGMLREQYILLGILGATPQEPIKPAEELGCKAYGSLEALLADTPDYVVEAAGSDAVRQYGARILAAGSNLILLSVGALADETFRHSLGQAAEKCDCKIYLPSGAIGGLDVLRAMRLMDKDMKIRVENRKAPHSLEGAPGLAGKQLSIEREELVFSGSALEAIRSFPKNVNVAVAAALSGVGPENTTVEIVSVPGLEENSHEFHQAIVGQEGQKDGADGNQEAQRAAQAYKQEGEQVRILMQLCRSEAEHIHDGTHKANHFEDGEDDVLGALVPCLLGKGHDCPGCNYQQHHVFLIISQ